MIEFQSAEKSISWSRYYTHRSAKYWPKAYVRAGDGVVAASTKTDSLTVIVTSSMRPSAQP